jgi:hypothetical protein
VLAPGTEVLGFSMAVDIDTEPVQAGAILTKYPKAQLYFGQSTMLPQIYVFFPDGEDGLIADGQSHATTSGGIVSPASSLAEERDGFVWSDFINEPYRLTGTPTLQMSFRSGGQAWYTSSAGTCSPDNEPFES